MATVDELTLAQQTVTDITCLRRDLWSLTSGYLTQLQSGPDQLAVTVLIGKAQNVAAGGMQRVNRITTLLGNPTAVTALTNGLNGMNCTIASANTLYTNMKNAVTNFQTAVNAAVTATDLQNACTTYQAAMPQPITLW